MLAEAAKPSAVNIASMADVKDRHDLLLVIYLVNHAVVTYLDAPSFATFQLEAAGRSGILSKSTNGIADPLVDPTGQLGNSF